MGFNGTPPSVAREKLITATQTLLTRGEKPTLEKVCTLAGYRSSSMVYSLFLNFEELISVASTTPSVAHTAPSVARTAPFDVTTEPFD